MTPNKEQAAKQDAIDKMLLEVRSDKYGDSGNYNTDKLKAALLVQIAEAEKAAEQNAVAWCIGAIDDLHTNHSDTLQMSLESDRCYKGIKNTIRDRYRSVTGIDPAPNYPIKAALRSERLSELQEDGNG